MTVHVEDPPLLTGDVQLTVPLPPVTEAMTVYVWRRVALQSENVPPFVPTHDQIQGPLPVTIVAVPLLHKLVAGATVTVVPLLLPQMPLTGTVPTLAEQLAVVPPLLPAHFHDHGPVPETVDGLPVAQRLVVGILLDGTALLAPQAPLTRIGPVIGPERTGQAQPDSFLVM